MQKFDLHDFRRRNKLTQGELAEYLGISGSFLSRIESGQCALPANKLQRILSNDQGWLVPEMELGELQEPQVPYGQPKNDALRDALAALAKAQEQIDRLLAIIEGLTKK